MTRNLRSQRLVIVIFQRSKVTVTTKSPRTDHHLPSKAATSDKLDYKKTVRDLSQLPCDFDELCFSCGACGRKRGITHHVYVVSKGGHVADSSRVPGPSRTDYEHFSTLSPPR